jgi:hypothetical protein
MIRLDSEIWLDSDGGSEEREKGKLHPLNEKISTVYQRFARSMFLIATAKKVSWARSCD